jgi:DsbC/DsbD-like thiol-disulfide interchange protein
MRSFAALAVTALASIAALPAAAQEIGTPAVIDVLPGWRDADGTHVAAVRVTLAPGWKTYWRSPGDAGIPPRWDWSGSRNLASVAIRWPVPDTFVSGGLTTVGYHDTLVLPLVLTPRDSSQPIALEAVMDLGVCEDICVPVEAALSTSLPATPNVRRDARIRTALADRPATAAEAGAGPVACSLSPSSDGVTLTATVALPSQGGTEHVVAELPDPSIWVGPATVRRDAGLLTASVDIAPPRGAALSLDRSQVVLTVLARGTAVELRGCD